jgi:PHD/YefM family antitoxin component YafN of YafNO toxin-antitoxin module
MLDTRQIQPLTDFLRNHKTHLARLKDTRTPEVLTVNGRAEVVVLDADSYQEMVDRLHHLETIAAIQEGIASAERGELKSAEQVLAEMKARQALTLVERRAFLRLPLEERRRILAQQAETSAAFYEENPEWKEIQGGDLVE